MKKKVLSLLLTATLAVGCFAGCGNSGKDTPADTGKQESQATSQADSQATTGITDPNEVADEMTSEDGKYQIALVTDVGQLKDGSFNEGTWNGVKLFAANNGKSYKYYQPANGANATDDDRYNAMAAACEGGADIIVAPGFLQATALEKAAKAYPDTQFLFIDGWAIEGCKNIAAVVYQEEQCGYFAGYAVVKDGFEKLGFCGGGGGTNPACCRYLYGFVQGANAAAAEMNKTVEMNYTWLYGESDQPSTELQTLATGWYTNGTEIIFACGGTLCQSVFAAASANDKKTVGVDVDQSGDSDTVVTSAMKELANSVQQMAAKFYDGTWSEVAGTCKTLGAADNDTGLPTAADSWRFETFTVEDYQAMFDKVVSGELKVDADYEKNLNQEYSNLKLTEVK